MATPERAALSVLTPHGDIDASTIEPLSAQMSAAAQAGASVILDAAAITFGDSTFLNLLLSTHRQTDLRIAAVPDGIGRLLSLTGADTVLRLFHTVEQARVATPPPPEDRTTAI
ncbi:STAS domain-containing protein [Streptomyces sp. V4-01]|uniref:STAS domain-containing protein n=1 Tax=Actinacidiphila polyblastidii TaxID=3110430 RepID=A0ABU7PDT7_9ACTN|nr:STAS domain-containing protein [Streptomyces sp. V4-01]